MNALVCKCSNRIFVVSFFKIQILKSTAMTCRVSERFFNALKRANFCREDLAEFRFCGIVRSKRARDDHVNRLAVASGLEYFERYGAPGTAIPPHSDRCICGSRIQLNAYIKHDPTGQILTIGGDCCGKIITLLRKVECLHDGCCELATGIDGVCKKHRRAKKRAEKAAAAEEEEAAKVPKKAPAGEGAGEISRTVEIYMEINKTPDAVPILVEVVPTTRLGRCRKCDNPTTKSGYFYCTACFKTAQKKNCISCGATMMIGNRFAECFRCFSSSQ
jgi:hypothetical protein